MNSTPEAKPSEFALDRQAVARLSTAVGVLNVVTTQLQRMTKLYVDAAEFPMNTDDPIDMLERLDEAFQNLRDTIKDARERGY